MAGKKTLLHVIEFGGYANFTPTYERAGFQPTLVTSVRRALAHLKKHIPDVVVAEFNFQSDFRDRSSSLETLMAPLSRMPDVRLIVFLEADNREKFEQRFLTHFKVFEALTYPIRPERLEAALQRAAG